MQLNKYIISTLLGFTLLTSLSAQSSVDIATPKSASRVHESYQLIYSGPILKKDSHYQDKSNLRKKITSGAPLGAKVASQASVSKAEDLIKQISQKLEKPVIPLKDKGYKIEIPHKDRRVVVRVMEQGGGRENYYRVSIDGKEAFTKLGEASTDRALTHIDIGKSSCEDILSLVESITKDIGPKNGL